jgi:hypothetical protein
VPFHLSNFLEILHWDWVSCLALFLDMFLNHFLVCLDGEVCWPKPFIFLRAKSKASYSVVLFVGWKSSAKISQAMYLITIPVGNVTTADILTPLWQQAPSHCTTHGVLIFSLGLWVGDVLSTMKSAKTCDLIALLLSKSIVYSDTQHPTSWFGWMLLYSRISHSAIDSW